jgi:hypothetical protein
MGWPFVLTNWLWLFSWWHERRRWIDLNILWPSYRAIAPDLNHAKAAFAVHAFNDAAWLVLGEAEIERIIDGLG